MSEMPERIFAWMYTGGFNRGEWLGRKSVTTDVEYIRADLASLSSAAVAEREPVAQFRKAGCSDWYDGLPDHQDGRGPYEKRTLYLDPPPTSELEAENARLQARVAELDKAVFDIQIMSVASAACFTNAQLENILTMIERTARRVREGGKS